MTEERGQEPSGWELLRAVQHINSRLDAFVNGFVSSEVHALLVERVREIEDDVRDEKRDREQAVAAMRKYDEEQRKTRAQTLTAIIIAGVSVVFGIFGEVFRQGFGL